MIVKGNAVQVASMGVASSVWVVVGLETAYAMIFAAGILVHQGVAVIPTVVNLTTKQAVTSSTAIAKFLVPTHAISKLLSQ